MFITTMRGLLGKRPSKCEWSGYVNLTVRRKTMRNSLLMLESRPFHSIREASWDEELSCGPLPRARY